MCDGGAAVARTRAEEPMPPSRHEPATQGGRSMAPARWRKLSKMRPVVVS